MSYNNIPHELTELKQWVVTFQDKIPRNPRTGKVASVTDSASWGTYSEAIQANAPAIGFVLTPWDPYTIIDLDNKEHNPCTEDQLRLHNAILNGVPSYIERSTSGTGYHIVCKGLIPAAVHRDNVEIYSHSRYMIFTGNRMNGLPINDCQQILDGMYAQMYVAPTRINYEDQEEVLSDAEIVEMAGEAINGRKFDELCRGEWHHMYSSQSEADLALVSMLTFYSPSDEQVKRIFRLTELAHRDKAIKNDKYLNFTIGRARTTQAVDPVEIEEIPINLDGNKIEPNVVTNHVSSVPNITVEDDSFQFPSGLVGEIAKYIYSSAQRPIKKVALAAALGFFSGLVGRTFNYSNTGLNQYIVLCADTGSGKEDGAKGIDRLVHALAENIPMIEQYAGPANFASGQAMIKQLDKQKCFFSVMGEFGLTMARITDPKSSGPDKAFHRVLLDLYSKSGWDQYLRPSVYADADKNTQTIKAPNVTIIGDTTPDTFYGRLTTANIADGLLPRFLIFNYKGKRPRRNPNAAHPPSEWLIENLKALATIVISADQNQLVRLVGCNEDAQAYLDRFDIYCDDQINLDGANSAHKQLWNRAHLKALKLSAILAIGDNMHRPIISMQNAQYSVQLVCDDVNDMMANFDNGIIAGTEVKRETIILDACNDYIKMDYRKRLSYIKNTQVAKLNIIPIGFLRRRVRSMAEFQENNNIGQALDNAIKALVAMGDLQVVSQAQLIEQGIKTRMDAYTLVNRFQ